jgi:hypothetical protein
MQTRALTVPKGRDVLRVAVASHTHVLLKDDAGDVYARSDSETRHVSFVVHPGRYTLETDGKIRKAHLARLESRHAPRALRADRPPKGPKPPKRAKRRR